MLQTEYQLANARDDITYTTEYQLANARDDNTFNNCDVVVFHFPAQVEVL